MCLQIKVWRGAEKFTVWPKIDYKKKQSDDWYLSDIRNRLGWELFQQPLHTHTHTEWQKFIKAQYKKNALEKEDITLNKITNV